MTPIPPAPEPRRVLLPTGQIINLLATLMGLALIIAAGILVVAALRPLAGTANPVDSAAATAAIRAFGQNHAAAIAAFAAAAQATPHAKDEPMRTNRRPAILRPLIWLALAAATIFFLFSEDIVPGNRRLYDAIEQGDVAAAKRLLDAGADPNSRWRGLDQTDTNRYQFKPLICAMWRGHPEIAQLLVEAGADPNVRTLQGEPALILAANGGHVELVRVLLAHGADPAISMASGETALHYGSALQGMPKDDLDPEVRALLEAAGAE